MNPEDQQEAKLSIVCENTIAMLNVRKYTDLNILKSYNQNDHPGTPWLKAVVFAAITRNNIGQKVLCVYITQAEKSSSKAQQDALRKEIITYPHFILIYDGTLPKALTIFYLKEQDKNLETIFYKTLLLNLMLHDETEKSQIISKTNKDFLYFLKISSLSIERLPKKNANDPMMIWIGAKVGDIIITSRIYESSGILNIYELVVPEIKDTDAKNDE